jgi:3-hydroxyisobutyrate dehydrogenase-like beta-hydroxyacid dehydrogenase
MTRTAKQRVGFVGLGHMGGNMAGRLLAAGYSVDGQALHRSSASELERQGLHWHETARRLAEAVEIIFTSLPDDAALEAAASGPDGILAGLDSGKIWVDVSTVSPRASRALAERAAGQGSVMLDAPVSGSVPQVQSGTLTIMVGGDEDAYRRVEPILRELGTPTRIGENGQGLVLKLAINISLAVQMLAYSEGLLLAAREGVDPARAAEVMIGSAIGSPLLKARAPLVLDLPEDAWFDVRLMRKDIRLALALAGEFGLRLPAADAADEELARAEELGYGARDIASAYEVLARMGST